MIVCCGEALIDFLPRTGSDGASVFQPFPGGSVLNVAIALGRLDQDVGFLSGMSTDFFGDILVDHLHASNVDTGFCHFSDRPSILAFVSLTDGHARYAFYDDGSAGRMLLEDDLPALPDTVRALHFGSISLITEPGGSTYEALMKAQSPRRVISFDPNVRPTLIRDRDAYLARIERMAGMADIVKLSDDDLEWLAPDGHFENLAADWLARGARLIILTRGAEGARAVSHTVSASVSGVDVTVADTIGAGDTFSAATLARLASDDLLDKETIADLSDDQLGAILGHAAAAAAITASRPGADPPWLREMG